MSTVDRWLADRFAAVREFETILERLGGASRGTAPERDPIGPPHKLKYPRRSNR